MDCDPVVLKYAEPSQEGCGTTSYETDGHGDYERFQNFTIPRDADVSLPYPLITLIQEVAEERPVHDETPEIRALFRDVWFPPATLPFPMW